MTVSRLRHTEIAPCQWYIMTMVMLTSSCQRNSDNPNIKDTGWTGRRSGACSVLVGVLGGGPLMEIRELQEWQVLSQNPSSIQGSL